MYVILSNFQPNIKINIFLIYCFFFVYNKINLLFYTAWTINYVLKLIFYFNNKITFWCFISYAFLSSNFFYIVQINIDLKKIHNTLKLNIYKIQKFKIKNLWFKLIYECGEQRKKYNFYILIFFVIRCNVKILKAYIV